MQNVGGKDKMRKFFACLISALFLVIPLTKASMLEQLDTHRLTLKAQAIRIGQVTDQWSSWDPDRNMVFTYTKLNIDQTLKGKKREELLIRQPGGMANGLRMVVHGVAQFKKGERALVFIQHDVDGAPSVLGMTQGKYRIYKSAVTGEEMAVFRAPSDVEFFQRTSNGLVHSHGSHAVQKRILLRDLIDEIQTVLRLEGQALP